MGVFAVNSGITRGVPRRDTASVDFILKISLRREAEYMNCFVTVFGFIIQVFYF